VASEIFEEISDRQACSEFGLTVFFYHKLINRRARVALSLSKGAKISPQGSGNFLC